MWNNNCLENLERKFNGNWILLNPNERRICINYYRRLVTGRRHDNVDNRTHMTEVMPLFTIWTTNFRICTLLYICCRNSIITIPHLAKECPYEWPRCHQLRNYIIFLMRRHLLMSLLPISQIGNTFKFVLHSNLWDWDEDQS